MKILVTGGAGLIGSSAVDRLVESGHEVVALLRSAPVRKRGLRHATREVMGGTGDLALMNELMSDGIDAVLHLAAIPSPGELSPLDLIEANAITTLTVMQAAGVNGVKTFVLASSISGLGMAWSAELMSPLYVPIDEEHPLRPTEGYALSKEFDEASARMAALRWGMTVLALRFPYTTSLADIDGRAAAASNDEEQAIQCAKELWAYLDLRDAARACELAIEAAANRTVSGATVLNIIADDVILNEPLDELLAQWHPDVPVSPRGLGKGAYTIDRAADLIGFEARYFRERVA